MKLAQVLLGLALIATAAHARPCRGATTPGSTSIKLVPVGSATIVDGAGYTTINSNTPNAQPADPGATVLYCNGALDIHWAGTCPTAALVEVCQGANCDARGIDVNYCTANGFTFIPVNLRLDFTNPNVHPWYPTASSVSLNVSTTGANLVVYQVPPNLGTAVSCNIQIAPQG